MVRVAVCFTDQDALWADHVSQWAAVKGYDVDRLANDVLLGGPSALRLHLVEADALLGHACRSAMGLRAPADPGTPRDSWIIRLQIPQLSENQLGVIS